MKVIDLFSGIGGFALGLESTGYFETVQFVENEKWCQKILKKNFKGVPIHDDIKTFKGYHADLVVGGFPCQPFSVAGKGKATQDDRHLWPEMFRVIKETKPTWVIGENVRNIVSISDGMVLEQVYLDLESQGYEVQSFIIPASAVNAPHQRYRTWIVAYSECNKHRQEIRSSSEKTSEVQREHRENDNQSWQSSRASSVRFSNQGHEYVAYSDNEGLRTRINGPNNDNEEKSREKRDYRTRSTSNDERSNIKTTENETMDVADTDLQTRGYWDSEPNVGRVANGIPNRVDRLRGLGNAIVPQIAYQIGMAIAKAEHDS
jgi:DNA (cytosine-5)-methyltransferase 1